MIDLTTFSTAELLQLYSECAKIKCLVLIGIKPTDDEILARVNPFHLGDNLTILQNHILHILNTKE